MNMIVDGQRRRGIFAVTDGRGKSIVPFPRFPEGVPVKRCILLREINRDTMVLYRKIRFDREAVLIVTVIP